MKNDEISRRLEELQERAAANVSLTREWVQGQARGRAETAAAASSASCPSR